MFGPPLIKLSQVENPNGESSDDDVVDTKQDYIAYISQLVFILKPNNPSKTQDVRIMHGYQLSVLVDDKGRFFLSHIQQYFPNIDTIIIKYIKFPIIKNKFDQLLISQSKNKPVTNVKIIDVVKRYDIRNLKSCKLGVTL